MIYKSLFLYSIFGYTSIKSIITRQDLYLLQNIYISSLNMLVLAICFLNYIADIISTFLLIRILIFVQSSA